MGDGGKRILHYCTTVDEKERVGEAKKVTFNLSLPGVCPTDGIKGSNADMARILAVRKL